MNRIDTFIRWWVHQLRVYDCDPSIYMMKYVIDRMELNLEQRYWFCWIYANTYQLATAWVIFNEFPDYENAPVDRIARWSDEHRSRLPYQKDQKWLRGNLGETFASYRKNLDVMKQSDWFASYASSPDPQANFTSLWNVMLKDFHRFGRYTTWFYLQTLKEVCGLRVEPTSLMLSFDSSAAHRAGLCLALGHDEWAVKGNAFTKETLALLDSGAADILSRVEPLQLPMTDLPVGLDYFSMETSLCAFKKLFRREQGRYLGYYLDRQAEDITKTASCDWPGINWQLLWDARRECLLPEFNNLRVSRENYGQFLDYNRFTPMLSSEHQLDSWLNQHIKNL